MNSMESRLIDLIRNFFSYHDIDVTRGIVVAFSGGADSSALLALLSRCVPLSHLRALYVNHRLRSSEELAVEVAHNRQFCEALGIPFTVAECNAGSVLELARKTGGGIEAAAREFRYTLLEEERVASGMEWVATAHTADDQLETVLMRVLRGSSVLSLKGIEPVNGHILRPLLEAGGDELREYLRSLGLDWSEDSTNENHDYTRNKIRHDLVPIVHTLFPAARETVGGVARRAGTLARHMERSFPDFEKDCVCSEGAVSYPLASIEAMSDYEKQELVYFLWHRLHMAGGQSPRPLGFSFVEHVVRDVVGQGRRLRARGVEVGVADGQLLLHFTKGEGDGGGWCIPFTPCAGPVVHEVPDEDVLFRAVPYEEGQFLSSDSSLLRIDHALLEAPCILRSWQAGDSIELLEGRKKVSDMLSGWKIPPLLRKHVFVLEDVRGIQALWAHAWGGKDRLSVFLKSPHLVGKKLTLYSVVKRNEHCGY